ncbi:MAG: hypothetical protein GX621_07845 [Pirellulaceae bacterium]|nr:hypothetical protein [Pirellulaceae bacterium]
MKTTVTVGGCALLMVLLASNALTAAERVIPRPLPDHPGNLFVEGEDVVIGVPETADATWRVVDYDGRVVAEIRGKGKLVLGRLPIGYYELHPARAEAAAGRPISLGVVAVLQSPTPATSPIACDVAMAWFYPERLRMVNVASLCALAGLNWVRDRLSWPEVEPGRDQLAPRTRYDDSAETQAAAGLKVLQANHSSPEWAGKDRKRFPDDLRDAHHFYREIARRWKDKVMAIEPWNEADIAGFGGHTGSEIASLQKASYLGIKAGNPEAVVCQNAFARHRASTLHDFHANHAWPYFDTFNLHHYNPVGDYPRIYAAFREVSAGRPLWVSECNFPVNWSGDQRFAEPSEADSRVQAERVAKVYACSLHEGSSAVFYFILGHYVETHRQFGILRPDLSPRPAFLAMAAVGRFLADAKPLGKLKTDASIAAYAFRANPDGQERLVLVAWANQSDAKLTLPLAFPRRFDHLGRRKKADEDAALTLSAAPVFAVLPIEDAARVVIEPPPAAAPVLDGKPSNVVLQAVWPRDQVELDLSAYRLAVEQPQTIPVFVYNFGDEPAEGRLTVEGPTGWGVSASESVKVAPNQRVPIRLTVEPRDADPKQPQPVAIHGDFGPAGQTVLSLPLLPKTP